MGDYTNNVDMMNRVGKERLRYDFDLDIERMGKMKRLLLLAFALCYSFMALARLTVEETPTLLGFVKERPCNVKAFEIEEGDSYYYAWAEGLPDGLEVYTFEDEYEENGRTVVDTDVWIYGETSAQEDVGINYIIVGGKITIIGEAVGYWCDGANPPYNSPQPGCGRCGGKGDYCLERTAAIPTDTEGVLSIPSKINGMPVTAIGSMAFSGCRNLTVIIPEGVTSIGRRAFYDSENLTVSLPSTVKGCLIDGWNVFLGAGISSFEVAENNPNLCVKNGFLCNKKGTQLIAAPYPLQSEVVPQGITEIMPGAFGGCEGEGYSVLLPNTLKKIGQEAFDGSGLASIIIPEGVTTIGLRAFGYCTNLKRVEIPSTVKKIDTWMFDWCQFTGPEAGLQEVILHEGVTTIDWLAFHYALTRGARVYIPASVKTISGAGYASFDYYSVYFAGKPPKTGKADVFCSNEGDVNCGYYPLQYAAEWERVIDNEGMWKGLRMAPDMTPYEDEEWFDESAEHENRGGILYQDGYPVAVLDPAIKTFTIPRDCEWVGEGFSRMLQGCPNLKTINVEAGNPYYKSIGGVLYLDEGSGALSLVAVPPAITKVIIPKNCESVGEGYDLFRNCTKLAAINVEAGNPYYKSIGGVLYVDEGGWGLSLVAVPSAITKVTIPRNCESFGEGYGLFRNCTKLAAINVEAGNSYYKSIGGVLYLDEGGELYPIAVPPAITKVTIPKNCVSVGEGSHLFRNCAKLTAIDVEAGHPYYKSIGGVLYWIDGDVWDGETTLMLVAIPPAITRVTLSKNCEWIEDSSVFANCSQLTAIDVEAGNSEYKAIDGVLYNSDVDYLIAIPAKKGQVVIPVGVDGISESAYQSETPLTMTFMGEPSYDFYGFYEWQYDEWSGEERSLDFDVNVQYLEENAEYWEGEIENGLWCGYPTSMTTIDRWTYKASKGKVTITGRTIYNTDIVLEIPEDIDGVPVTEIAANAFKDDLLIESVWIPDGVTTIGANAFAGCSNLQVGSIYFPATVKKVGKGAFIGCLPNKVNEIVPGEKDETMVKGYTLATAAAGVKLDAKKGLLTASFTKPGVYDSVLFNNKGDLVLLRYEATEIPSISIKIEGGDDKCKVKGAGTYLVGKAFTLTATVPKYATFLGWYDETNSRDLGDSPKYVDTMTTEWVESSKAISIIARFKVELIETTLESLPEQMMVGDQVFETLEFTAAESEIKSVKIAGLPTGLKAGKLVDGVVSITGMPTKVGSYKVSATVTTKIGVVKTFVHEIEVKAEAAEIDLPDPTELAEMDVYVGGPSQEITLGLWAHSSVKSLTAKGLPAGLKLVKNNLGEWQIVGVPTKAGTYTVSLTMTTSAGSKVASEMIMTVTALPAWCLGTYFGDVENGYYDWNDRVTVYGFAWITIGGDGVVTGSMDFDDNTSGEISGKGIITERSESEYTVKVNVAWYNEQGKSNGKTTLFLTIDDGGEIFFSEGDYDEDYVEGTLWK